MKFPGLILLAILFAAPSGAQDTTNEFLGFVKAQAGALRNSDSENAPPRSRAEWKQRDRHLRKELLQAWGGFPKHPAELAPRKLGEIQRDGYRIEKIIFQTLPDVWMTANAYVPETPGRHPALLMVHGHWPGAKQDPVVQARCIGGVKLGFFVLAVDAFGAGERGVGRALGEYHGDMTAATLLPAGLPLSGLQVYENMRAVDYLCRRPEVDAARIGVTGASGGGNQSMYAGAWDTRLRAAAPVCSVGNYQAYLGAACCMCEVVPGALRFTEEGDVLGLTAPRALLVINATKDSPQFSIGAADKSLEIARNVFDLFGREKNLRHLTFESPHAYNQPMREAVYGWMTLHLKGEGYGAPVSEPAGTPLDPEMLRCFPGDSRPADWMTIPRFAAREGERLMKKQSIPRSARKFQKDKPSRLSALTARLGGFPAPCPLDLRIGTRFDRDRTLEFTPEPGLRLTARESAGSRERLAIVVDLDGAAHAITNTLAMKAKAAGWRVITMDLRATGQHAWRSDRVGRAPDHTTAEWALWIGRPLLGEWTCDLRRLLDAVQETEHQLPSEAALLGYGPGGVVALAAAALDERITRVFTSRPLASYISDTPYEGQRLGIIVPAILRDFGDIADLAAMVAPRPLRISGAVNGSGEKLNAVAAAESFRRTAATYALQRATDQFSAGDDSPDSVERFLTAPR